MALYLKSLHHFCAANMGSESQAIALEILAFLCGAFGHCDMGSLGVISVASGL